MNARTRDGFGLFQKIAQIHGDIFDSLIAVFRILGQTTADNALNLVRTVLIEVLNRRGGDDNNFFQTYGYWITHKRLGARGRFEADVTERETILLVCNHSA